MARLLAIVLAVALSSIGMTFAFHAEEARAQQFPASAVIRGENIRLRLEPAADTDDVTVLQRGDEVTITGDVTSADGLAFYPVEVGATGDAGWVRDIFIDPKTIVPVAEPAAEPAAVAEAEPAPEAEEEPAPEANAEEGNNQRRERPARENRQNRQTREAAADEEAAPEEGAAAEEAADQADADAANTDAAARETAATPAEEAVAVAAGTGNARSQRFALEPGRYRLTAAMEASEAGTFVCDVFGPDEFTESLFDETIDEPQSWTAETNLRIRGQGGDFYVECSEAGGDWTISFAPA